MQDGKCTCLRLHEPSWLDEILEETASFEDEKVVAYLQKLFNALGAWKGERELRNYSVGRKRKKTHGEPRSPYKRRTEP